MDISFKDAQRLWSGLWHKKEVVDKKRRWLMQLPLQDSNEVDLKVKKPRSLSNMFLAESFMRRDEDSSQAVKINVERNYSAVCLTEEWLHDFHNYMVLSDVYILQSFLLEPSNLMKFNSRLDLLSNNALELLVKLLTEEKICSERTRPRMQKIIKIYFPNALSASKDVTLMATLRQLYEILRNPENYKEKQQPSIMTSGCSSTLPSIYKALELLDRMPTLALSAFFKKLRGKKMASQFPPPIIGYNKKVVIQRIRRRCEKLIQASNDENSTPAELAKAMSVIHLYFKYQTKCSETFTTKFFSFSVETIILQNDILKALWSIPKVASHQMKALQAILGVKSGGDAGSSFLNDLKRYLMQYLLEFDETETPSDDISNILNILNQNSCGELRRMCSSSKETVEIETEAVLNVSIELKHVVSHVLPSCRSAADEKAAEEDDDDTRSNDFELVENEYCSSTTAKHQRQQRYGSSNNGELEATGDSMPGTVPPSSATIDGSSKSINHCFEKKIKEEPSFQNTEASKDFRDVSIKELCDETSLVSYRLIGRMLNRLLFVEGRDVDITTRHLLTGEALYSTASRDSCGEDAGIRALMHSVKNLLPSVYQRGAQRLEKLMKQP